MEIADKLAKSPAFQRARLSSLPYNLVKSRKSEKYFQILTNLVFLEAKINHPELGLQALINDYDLIDEAEVSHYSESNYSKVKALKLIQGALRLSAHILNEDKTQLAGQLLIRLQYFQISEIKTILEQAKKNKSEPWLRPLSPSLTPPGGRLLRTLRGHNGAVLAVTVTPNGRYLISASKDHTIKVWNLQTGEELFTLSGHNDWVLTLAVTPDSKQIISGSKDKTIKIWSLETGKELFTLKNHTRKVNVLAVTSDGKQVISASDDSTFRVWSLETKKEVFSYYNYGDNITALTITPDSEKVIFASSSTKIIIWSLVRAKKLLTLTAHKDTISALAVTSDGKYLISGSWDKTLKIWSLESKGFFKRRLLFTIKGHSGRITAVIVTPDSKRIISDSLDNTLKVWDLETLTELFPLKENTDEINPLAVTPDGRWLVSGSEDNSIKVWNLEETTEDKFIPLGHSDKVNALAVTSNNRYLISSSEDNKIKVWSLEIGKELFTLSGDESLSITQEKFYFIKDIDELILILYAFYELPVFKVRLEQLFTFDDFDRLLDVFPKYTFKVLNLKTSVVEFGNHIVRVFAIIIKNKYRGILYKSWRYNYSENYEPELKLQTWDISKNRQIIIRNYDIYDNPAIVTPDANHLISRSKDNSIAVWNLETGDISFKFSGRIPMIKNLIVSQDSKLVIVGLADKTISIFDIKNKQKLFNLAGHKDFFSSLAITPDNQKLISASFDKTIKIWNLKTGELLFTIHYENYAKNITITLDGKWIISELVCDDFPIVRVWDIYTGEEVFTLIRHDENTLKVYNSSSKNTIASFSVEDKLECCTLAPDGVTIVAGDELGVLHFFRLEGFIHRIESLPKFQQILQEKSANSIAREFVFTAINNFLNRHDRGYFTIVGAPGSGKSAILAKYVTENPDVFYYNAQVKGKNRAEEFLKAITIQVEAVHVTSLQVILQQISDQLEPNQKFIIAIDSLDAIDTTSQPGSSNLFYLPRYLPKGIYFILARRPFLREKSGLLIEAPFEYLNLQDYPEENRRDIQTYIQKYLQEFLPSLSASNEIFGVSKEEFIKQLTSRSENNFMYVSQILIAIKNGFDSEKSCHVLEEYYRKHLEKMLAAEQGEEYNSNARSVLNLLVRNSSPISVEDISQIINADEYDVEEILEDWIEFLNVHRMNGETCYRLYHESFRNWLIQVKI
ncbi:MAG: AAA family ATPase [Rivularia sp. (in: cyanobacteria)]